MPAMKLARSTLARSRPAQCLQIPASSRRCFTIWRACREQQNGSAQGEKIDVETLLSNPTWSISSLLPSKRQDPSTATAPAQDITPTQLHHLLRLSALPPPSSPEQETEMLSTLRSQLHFVRSIQEVDTSGVEPLRSLRDETVDGEREAELGMDEMREALESEEVKGKWHRRVRRKRERREGGEGEQWDVLGQAVKKTGRYFVVEGGKKRAEEESQHCYPSCWP